VPARSTQHIRCAIVIDEAAIALQIDFKVESARLKFSA
jgi:hypothetical protein